MNKLNNEIRRKFKGTDYHDEGIAYLLCLYHNLDTDFIPDKTIRKVNTMKIFNVNFNQSPKGLEWNTPLYEDEVSEKLEEDFAWVRKWMEKFGNINKERRGNFASCVQRMKKWREEYPGISIDRICYATDQYIKSVSSPTFVKNSHKFIFEGRGIMRVSHLWTWVEKTKEQDVDNSINPRLQTDDEDSW